MVRTKNKVIWAVDAFSKDSLLNKKLAAFLKTWVASPHGVIEPVYVLSPDQIPVPSELFSTVAEESEESARKALKALTTYLPGKVEATLLRSNDFSLRTAVKTLIDHARSNGAEIIAVGTQSKKGVSRFLFGSFAETLLLFSDIPILMVTPASKPSAALKRMVFATDLTESSQAAFLQALDLAERHRLFLTLYNRVEYSCEKTSEMMRQYPEYEGRVDEDLSRRTKAMQAMSAAAHARGIKVNVLIDSKPSDSSIAEAILKVSQNTKADLVAVAAESGVTRSTLVGSVTREVLRKAKLPVWVIHPQLKQNESSNTKKGAA